MIPVTRLLNLLAVTMAACIASGSAQAQDASTLRLRSLAASCAQCHGTDGRAVEGAALPGLAGVPAARFVEQMSGYKSGARNGTLMPQIAKGFSDAQIAQLADYFAALAPVPKP